MAQPPPYRRPFAKVTSLISEIYMRTALIPKPVACSETTPKPADHRRDPKRERLRHVWFRQEPQYAQPPLSVAGKKPEGSESGSRGATGKNPTSRQLGSC